MPDFELSDSVDNLQKKLLMRVPFLSEKRVGNVILGKKLFVNR